MVMTDETWHIIRNVRGVTGFVGTSGNDPTPLTEEEVDGHGRGERQEIIVELRSRRFRQDYWTAR